MKKILSIFSALVLTGSAATVLTTNIQTHQTKTNESKDIDWSLFNEINTNYFNNFKKSQQNQLMQYSTAQVEQAIKIAQQKASEYGQLFQNQNFNLDQIIEYLANENINFKESYHNSLQKQFNLFNNQINSINNITTLSNSQDLAKLENLVKNLKTSKTIFTTITATAAVAAAGFWAAAWWFGISVPWAIGCTGISVASGTITTALNIALVTYNKEMNKYERAAIWGSIAYSLGHIFYDIIKIPLVVSTTTVTASTWAFPAAKALIPVISAIFAWISVYK